MHCAFRYNPQPRKLGSPLKGGECPKGTETLLSTIVSARREGVKGEGGCRAGATTLSASPLRAFSVKFFLPEQKELASGGGQAHKSPPWVTALAQSASGNGNLP